MRIHPLQDTRDGTHLESRHDSEDGGDTVPGVQLCSHVRRLILGCCSARHVQVLAVVTVVQLHLLPVVERIAVPGQHKTMQCRGVQQSSGTGLGGHLHTSSVLTVGSAQY